MVVLIVLLVIIASDFAEAMLSVVSGSVGRSVTPSTVVDDWLSLAKIPVDVVSAWIAAASEMNAEEIMMIIRWRSEAVSIFSAVRRAGPTLRDVADAVKVRWRYWTSANSSEFSPVRRPALPMEAGEVIGLVELNITTPTRDPLFPDVAPADAAVDVMDKSAVAIACVTPTKPLGYRSNAWDMFMVPSTKYTISMLLHPID